ncbi:hypothetical protein CASFOL_031183 [Castilleja foliolosa]|uniref:PHD-type zinc finger plants domain-containing protein n=1 Tax=Castilleja foliolosa TaxID=1961234 RepID=A0ABD3C406_9LAMI
MKKMEIVCCMCGDVGFSDKLFRCSNCRNRFQHSYCSNYYRENAAPIEICDWCQCEDQRNSSSSSRSGYSGGKIRPHYGGEAAEKVAGKSQSPRTTTRRYKLLKDVMC